MSSLYIGLVQNMQVDLQRQFTLEVKPNKISRKTTSAHTLNQNKSGQGSVLTTLTRYYERPSGQFKGKYYFTTEGWLKTVVIQLLVNRPIYST